MLGSMISKYLWQLNILAEEPKVLITIFFQLNNEELMKNRDKALYIDRRTLLLENPSRFFNSYSKLLTLCEKNDRMNYTCFCCGNNRSEHTLPKRLLLGRQEGEDEHWTFVLFHSWDDWERERDAGLHLSLWSLVFMPEFNVKFLSI